MTDTLQNGPDFNAFDKCIEPIEDKKIPSMVFPADPVVPEVVDAIPTLFQKKTSEKYYSQINSQ